MIGFSLGFRLLVFFGILRLALFFGAGNLWNRGNRVFFHAAILAPAPHAFHNRSFIAEAAARARSNGKISPAQMSTGTGSARRFEGLSPAC